MSVKVRGRERVIEITGPGVVGSKNRGPSDAEEILVPYILAQSAVPVILPSSGSSNATGQITLTTALPYQPSGVVQIYLPSGVVTAGSAGTGAGLYPVVFSSTTVCQVQGTGIVSANGAYTQSTSQATLLSATLPGGAMGANGAVRVHALESVPSNANAKTLRALLAGNRWWGNSLTASAGAALITTVRNRGSQSVQLGFDANTGDVAAGSPGAINNLSVDTSVNQSMTITGQLAVATDYIILEGYTVEVLPSA